MGQHQAITMPPVTAAVPLRRRLLGVLGGMGPLATADFLRKLIELTPAACDQEHVPLIVYSVPQIPDRSSCIEGRGASPLPAMLAGLRCLKAAGAEIIAMPCNTAHYWYDPLCRQTGAEFLHIVDTVADALLRQNVAACPVGLLATTGTIRADIYGSRLAGRGYSLILPGARQQENLVMAGIRAVKAGRLSQAHGLLQSAAADLAAAGARAVILGCTEIPLALPQTDWRLDVARIDATEALAQACIARSLAVSVSAVPAQTATTLAAATLAEAV
jgi:aspartate racemase